MKQGPFELLWQFFISFKQIETVIFKILKQDRQLFLDKILTLIKTYFYLSFHRLFPISNRPLESRSQIVRQRKFSVEDKYSQ